MVSLCLRDLNFWIKPGLRVGSSEDTPELVPVLRGSWLVVGTQSEDLWPKSTCSNPLLSPCFCVGDWQGTEKDKPEILTEGWKSKALLFTHSEENLVPAAHSGTRGRERNLA